MPASVQSAMNKLHDSLQAIRFHEGVKPQEGKRIEEAFILFSLSEGSVESKTQKRRECYRKLLKNLHKAAGRQAVLLCAVSFGQSAAANMRESLKIGLVAAVKAQKEALSCTILEKLVEEYSSKVSLSQNAQQSAFDLQLQWTEGQGQLPTASGQWVQPQPLQSAPLIGDFYGLTIQDAQAITMSDQVRGTIYLTNTYNINSSPVITIPISRELSNQLATQRVQLQMM